MADAQQNGVAGMPDLFLALTVAPGAHLLIDPIGGTAQRQLAQGDEVALAKEVLDGPLGLAADIDFSLIEPLTQIVGGRSTSTTSSAASKNGSGTVSRTCTPVMPLTTSFRLSRCWTLTVVNTSMPASSSSSTSCQRLG